MSRLRCRRSTNGSRATNSSLAGSRWPSASTWERTPSISWRRRPERVALARTSSGSTSGGWSASWCSGGLMTMLRIEVSEAGQGALPASAVGDAVIVIGSGAAARVRLPAGSVLAEHVRIEGGRWRALGDVKIDGVARDGGDVGDGVTLDVGTYRVRITPA